MFKAQAAQTIGRGAPLLRFFGLYYTATSLLTFLLQTFLTRPCVKRPVWRFPPAHCPPAVRLGSLAGLLFPGFPSLAGIRAMEILMRGSLYRSAYEMFYTAVAPADKRAVKSLIDVGRRPGGRRRWLGRGHSDAGPGARPLWRHPGAGIRRVALIALLLAARLQRGYLQALEKSLVDRAVELDPSHDRGLRDPLCADAVGR